LRILFETAPSIGITPRLSRICLLVRLIVPCRLQACARSTLPFAVCLNRFPAELPVFSLGIVASRFGVRVHS